MAPGLLSSIGKGVAALKSQSQSLPIESDNGFPSIEDSVSAPPPVEMPKIDKLPPAHAYLLDAIASNSTDHNPTADTYFEQAAAGKTVEDIGTAEMESNIRRRTAELTAEAMSYGLSEQDTVNYVKARMDGHDVSDVVANSAGKLIERFGSGPASQLFSGSLDNAGANEIIKGLTDQELEEAIRRFQFIQQNPPRPPKGAPYEQPNQWQILAAVLGSILAPQSAAEMLMTPSLFMESEKRRRDSEAQAQYESDRSIWAKTLDSQGNMVDNLLSQKAAEMKDETTRRSQDIGFQKTQIQEMGKNARAQLASATKGDMAMFKRGDSLLDVMLDDRYDVNSRKLAYDTFKQEFGYDPFSPGQQIEKGYRQTLGEAKTDQTIASTENTREKTVTERARQSYIWAQTKVSEERAKQLAVETELLPEKFDLEVWKATQDVRLKIANGQLSESKMELDAAKSLVSNMEDVRSGFSKTAIDLRSSAAKIEQEAATMDDGPEKDALMDRANTLKSKADEAQGLADQYGKELESKYKDLENRSKNQGSRFSNIGSKYMSGYSYSMQNRNSNSAVDCSSFVCRAYSDAGINVPSNTADGLWKSFEHVDRPQIGDAVFFRDNTPDAARSGREAHHVGLIVGFAEDGTPIMRHASQAADKVIDVRLDQYERSVRSDGLVRIGYGRPKGMPAGGSLPPKTGSLADHSSVLTVQYGLPTDKTQMAQLVVNPSSGWTQATSIEPGVIVFVPDEKADGGFRTLLVESIDYESQRVTYRAGTKTFVKKFSEMPRGVGYLPPRSSK